MNSILLFLLPSILATISLPFISNRRVANYLSFTLAGLSFLLAIPLLTSCYSSDQPLFFMRNWFICDKLGGFFIGLNSFITLTASFYAISYFQNEPITALHRWIYRFYNSFFHLFALCMYIVILSNNLGLLWISMELATIASVVLVALYQTHGALEAAWKYLILCGVGIGLALLGTVILYFTAHPYLSGEQGLLWTDLINYAPQFSTKLLAISFVFIFVGYGTKVGFFPLHNWLPDAYTETSPVYASMSSLLLNVALFAILRFKMILANTDIANFPSYLLLIFGFLNLLYAALSILRQRKLKRLWAYSSMEHMGIISIAFGIGTPLAIFAGFLHMMMHTITKSALFFSSGSIIQRFKTQIISQLKGLTTTVPLNGWSLVLCGCALLGLPPSGMFASELLLIFATLQTHAWLLIPLILGLFIAFVGIITKLQGIGFSTYPSKYQPLKGYYLLSSPVVLQLSIVYLTGIWLPIIWLQPMVMSLTQGILK